MSLGNSRSFIAIDLDDPRILAEVESVTSSLVSIGGDLKPVERENIHVTLKFLGDINQASLEHVKRALGNIFFHEFSLEVKGAGAFPGLRRINVVWVGLGDGSSEVERIYEETEKSLADLGFPRESRGFSPHVTIARVRSARRLEEVASFIRKLDDKSFGSFSVKRIRLKKSILTSSGPKYQTLMEVEAQNP